MYTRAIFNVAKENCPKASLLVKKFQNSKSNDNVFSIELDLRHSSEEERDDLGKLFSLSEYCIYYYSWECNEYSLNILKNGEEIKIDTTSQIYLNESYFKYEFALQNQLKLKTANEVIEDAFSFWNEFKENVPSEEAFINAIEQILKIYKKQDATEEERLHYHRILALFENREKEKWK